MQASRLSGEDTASINFTPLSGIDPDSPLCYLLEIDGFRILLDCGINELLDVGSLEPLRDVAKTVHAVLISHADLSHLGGLPYAVAKLGLQAPIYSTIPTFKMGQMFCYDAYQSRTNCVEFDAFSLDDVDACFEQFHQLKYSQHWSLDNGRIQITPYPAGRTLGGAVWRIVKDTEEIVYAVDFNHKAERHLASAALEQFRRPSLLITDAYNGLAPPSSRRKHEAELSDEIDKALRADGNVLIPVDTAGRVLEILLFLEQLWSEKESLKGYPLVFMTNISLNTLEFARSLLEWMSESIMDAFDARRDNPFSLMHVRMCHHPDELERVPSPKVVLASLSSLDTGFARDLFLQYARDARNRVIFPVASSSSSLAQKIMTASTPCSLPVTVQRRVPLVGAELDEWKERRRAEIEAARTALLFEQASKDAAAAAAAADAMARADDDAGDGDNGGSSANSGDNDDNDDNDGDNGGSRQRGGGGGDDDDDDENGAGDDDDDKATGNDIAYSMDTRSFFEEGTHDLFITPDIEDRAMFPCPPSPPDFDDYGEFVDHDDFRPADEYLGSGPSTELQAVNGGSGGGMALVVDDDEAATAAAGGGDEFGGEQPTKSVEEQLQLSVACRVRYIEFEGRSDSHSLKNIIHGISPRKLILVHGSPAAVDHLVQYAHSHIRTCENIATAAVGQPLQIKFQTSTFAIRIDDSLFSSLSFVKVGDYELSYLNAVVDAPCPASSSCSDDITTDDTDDGDDEKTAVSSSRKRQHRSGTAVLKEMPASRVRGHRPTFIGSVKLSDFKQTLTQAGFQAEFMGSGAEKALVVNGCVLLRKPPTSTQVSIEGTLTDDYFKIRELLYAQYTIV